jgi:hypothetical protein
MDFKTLLEPYAEPNKEGVPTRTVEGQIKWLTNRHHFPRDVVDKAILKVYNEIESGKAFIADDDGSAGHHLDRYLFSVCEEIVGLNVRKQAKELEDFLHKFKETAVEKYVAEQRGSVWKRVKAVFKPVQV